MDAAGLFPTEKPQHYSWEVLLEYTILSSVLVDVIQKSYSRHIPRQLLNLQYAGKHLIALLSRVSIVDAPANCVVYHLDLNRGSVVYQLGQRNRHVSEYTPIYRHCNLMPCSLCA